MATVKVYSKDIELTNQVTNTTETQDVELIYSDPEKVKEVLASIGIGYERWDTERGLNDAAEGQEVLDAFAEEIVRMKESGGYVTADVINIIPETPNLETMLARFSREHWHDEDEVRFIVEGRGLFHIRPRNAEGEPGPVHAIEVVKGDLIRVPQGTWHWFDLCEDRRIRAIRLFQDVSGWTPQYTDSDADKGYMPVCFGFKFIPAQFAKL
jgi:1,2-dihydroxy-3-keto-5-methylthiopentene dioxygenase